MLTFSSDGGREPASCSVSTTMRDIPFARARVRFTVAGMADADELSVRLHFDVPELGEDKSAFLLLASVDVKAVLILLEGEAMIAQPRTEAGISRLLSIPHASEKAVKG